MTNKEAIQHWEAYRKSLINSTPVPVENIADKRKRITRLEAHPEEWFKYYFPKYAYAEPAPFHKRATKRILKNKRWYEVRAWSRELAKDTRTMFEMLYMALTGQIKTVLMVSHSNDQAVDYLAPYRINLESNPRLISDYGEQKGIRDWKSERFTTNDGISFRAIGSRESPRGTKNEYSRPDVIIINDVDTDEKVLNPKRVDKDWGWIEQALIPTVSVSQDVRIIFLGNIISKHSIINKAMEHADHVDVINVRDKHGKSTWPEKNSEEQINWLLSKISYISGQKEYFNNPITKGTVFQEMRWDRVPSLHKFKFLILYGDPAPSNKENKANSDKVIVLLGRLNGINYIINARVEHVVNAKFVKWYWDMDEYVNDRNQVYNYIENNTLQDPFYEQVFKPLFIKQSEISEKQLGVIPDDRKKPDKFSRIEGNLEPLNSNGKLILNIAEKSNPHMKRLEEQFEAVEPGLSAPVDGPDAVEGGVWIINKKIVALAPVTIGKRGVGSYRNKNKF